MIVARTFGERVTLWCLRAAATVVTLAGASVLASSLATAAAPLSGELARLLPLHAVRIGAALAIGGVLALYLSGSRSALFRGERLDPAARPAPDAWTWAFVLTLLAAPAVMLWQLEPLARFWRDTFQLLAGLGPWEFRGGESSGLVLAPLFGMLALPSFETLAAIAFAVACMFLLLLVATRSRLGLRAVLACVALLGALAVAALLADDTMRRITPGLERAILGTRAGFPDEAAKAIHALERYHRVTGRAAHVLGWAWMALGLWVPLLVLRARSEPGAPASAAPLAGSPATPAYESTPSPRPAPARSVAADGADRERFYADAARLVDEGGAAGSRGRPMVVVLIVTLALLGLFALVSGLGALAAISRIVTR